MRRPDICPDICPGLSSVQVGSDGLSISGRWTADPAHNALERTNGSKGVGPKAWRWIGEMHELAKVIAAMQID